MKKKVLIVTYYWPPAGGIGVQRCLKFAKYLRNFGWEPIIFTAKNAQYPDFDHSNFKHIPEGIEVHEIPIFEPFNIFRKLSGRKPADPANPVYVRDKKRTFVDTFSIWIRGNFFIPDARACWIRPAVRHISQYLYNNKVDAIFTDGPPHTNTRIGYHLAHKHNIPWIADFQDPWTQVDYYKLLKIGPIADKIHKSMEQDVFRRADKITIASPSWAKDIEGIGAKNVEVLYYGYDEDDFIKTEPKNNDLFTVTHTGMLGIDRFPETLIDIFAEILEKNKEFRKYFRLNLPGQVDYSIKEYIHRKGLSPYSNIPGNISKPEALEALSSSSLLLLPINKSKNAKGRLPGKLYEYLRSCTEILALGPGDTDVGVILKDCNAGEVIDYEDARKLKQFINRKFKEFMDGQKVSMINFKKIEQYNVRIQTGKLAELLNEISNGR